MLRTLNRLLNQTHGCATIASSRYISKLVTSNRITAHTVFQKMENLNKENSSSLNFQQKFDYFLVLDFEATCENGTKLRPQEIIEFPVLKINSKTWETESVFHQYVRPIHHPQLTTFCIELTGIIQNQVDEQPDFIETMQLFKDWMSNEKLLDGGTTYSFVTCGDWDLKTCIKEQCQASDITIPHFFNRWINIKKPFSEVMGMYPKGMLVMMNMLGLKHEGRHHSGIDDCKNIAKILVSLAKKGFVYSATTQDVG